MKKAIILLLSILIVLSACKKDVVTAPNYLKANGDVILDTRQIDVSFKSLIAKDTLYISAHEGENNLIISIINKGKGIYKIGGLDALFYKTLGLDVIVQTFRLNTNADNVLTINAIDSDNISGTFSLSLTENTRGVRAPSTLILKNGKFNSAISKNSSDMEAFFRQYK